MEKIELLAPAGNFDNLKTAIYCGADAVYLGTKNYSARGKIENFDFQELKQAVEFAKIYDKRVYLAINTLIFDDELENAIDVVKNAIKFGVDAFIIQDFGLALRLKKMFPQINLHASTQMGVNNVAGAKILKQMGFSRVVLSRETPLEEIKKIKQIDIEIEYFVQGALCVCFSGNCYASGILFGESGNRGRCLQLCRLPYTANINGKPVKKGYLLSAKDFNLSQRLKDLKDAGVDSLKIEGRARRQGYVAVAVATYRNIIDNNFCVTRVHQDNLKKAFNRGDFTQGYFDGNGNIIDNVVQGHKGKYIGKVIVFFAGKKFNTIKIQSTYDINKNDGLKFFRNGKEVCSLSAMDVKAENDKIFVINTKAKVCVGDDVHVILDVNLENNLLSLEKHRNISANFVAKLGEKAKLELIDKTGEKVTIVSDEIPEKAKTMGITEKEVFAQISKMKETYYELEGLCCELDNVFVPKQVLNKMRREAVDLLTKKLCENKIKVEERKIDFAPKAGLENKQLKFAIISENTSCDISKFDGIIISPKIYNKDTVGLMLKKTKGKKVYLSVPNLMNSKDQLLINDILTTYPDLKVYGNNISAFDFKREVFVSPLMNVTNSLTAQEYYNLGAKNVCANFETQVDNIEFISRNTNANMFIYAYGNVPLMTLAHCPIKNNFSGNCEKCTYGNNIEYMLEDGKAMTLSRYKLAQCYFILKNKKLHDVVGKLSNTNIGMLFDISE